MTSFLAKNFDKISSVYRTISQKIYDQTTDISLSQIQSNIPYLQTIHQVLDLGCGDGSTLLSAKSLFPNAEFTGIDISNKMLTEAASKLTLNTYQSSIETSDTVLPQTHFDLCFTHFVLGYIALHTLLDKAQYLLKENGYISITTNTDSSFSNVKNIIQASFSKIKPIKHYIDYKIKQGIANSKNQVDWDNLSNVVQAHGFELIRFDQHNVDCEFDNAGALFDFIFLGSWGIGELKSFIPLSLYRFVYTKLLTHLAEFPIKDTAQINVILLKKIRNNT